MICLQTCFSTDFYPSFVSAKFSEIFIFVINIYHLLFQHQDGKIHTQGSMLNMIKGQTYSGIVDWCSMLSFLFSFVINIAYILMISITSYAGER